MRETLAIADADASFILGAKGRTKRKLARVARCGIQIDAGSTLVLEADRQESIDRAKLYVGFVMQQRVGPVSLGPEVELRDDFDTVEIPDDCVGYVTGHHGQGLRSIEEEFGTLMFFTDIVPTQRRESERLAIFCPCRRARTGSYLKVLSAIEQKKPGYFTNGLEGALYDPSEGFAVDKVPIKQDDFSYALGRGGSTRKKLARASNAIIEYVGFWAYIAGTLEERRRAADYLGWLCSQRNNKLPPGLTSLDRNDMMCIRLTDSDAIKVIKSENSSMREQQEEPKTEPEATPKDESPCTAAGTNDVSPVSERADEPPRRSEHANDRPADEVHLKSAITARCVGKPADVFAGGFLRRMEEQTDTFAFIYEECLLIFGADEDNRQCATNLALSRLHRLQSSARKRQFECYDRPSHDPGPHASSRYSKIPRRYEDESPSPGYRGWCHRDEDPSIRPRQYDSATR